MIETIDDLAMAIKTDIATLRWLCSRKPATKFSHYHLWHLAKRRGGTRRILIPKAEMKRAQRWILNEILDVLEIDEAALGYRRGKSIVDHANLHVGKPVVIRLDIRNFFESIYAPTVETHFQSLGYRADIAFLLTTLVTCPLVKRSDDWFIVVGPRFLPQGACTSPSLANLVCADMDRLLSRVAVNRDLTYSRYGDDLTFSGALDVNKARELIKLVKPLIERLGFSLNNRKTSIMHSGQRQMVTGLTVNDEVSIPRRKLREYRACVHRCEVYGLNQVSVELGRDALSYVRGYFAYIHMVSPAKAAALKRRYPWIDSNGGIRTNG